MINTSLLVIAFIKEDFPTLVYPTNDVLKNDCLLLLWTLLSESILFNFFLRFDILFLRILLSTSIWVSPAPALVPKPPICRSRWVHILVKRGNWYWSLASSTWVLDSFDFALLKKISRMTPLRSINFIFSSNFWKFFVWTGLRSSSKTT